MLVATCDFERAVKISSDENLLAIYRRVQTVLRTAPGETEEVFYHFVNTSGKNIIMAGSWIDKATIVEVATVTGVVTLPNINLSDLPKLKALLTEGGFSGFNVTTK